MLGGQREQDKVTKSLTPAGQYSDGGRQEKNTVPESKTRPAGQSGLEVWEDPVIDDEEAGCEEPRGRKDSMGRGLGMGGRKAPWRERWTRKELGEYNPAAEK